jgi:hypothetical protein
MTAPLDESTGQPSTDSVSSAVVSGTGKPSRWWYFGIGFLVILLIQLVRDPASVEQLLLGWLYFPARTIPAMTVDWPTATLGLICTGLFVPVLHWTIRWLIERSHTDGPRFLWTWRATGSVSLVLALLFCSGTAMVGATHQFVWLITGKPSAGSSTSGNTRPVGLWSWAMEGRGKSQEQNNLKFIGIGFQNAREAYRTLPPGGTMDKNGRLLHGWPIFLSYYMSYAPYDPDGGAVSFDRSLPWNHPSNAEYFRCGITEYINPALPGPQFDIDGFGLCHVAGNVHVLPLQVVESQTKDRFGWENPPKMEPEGGQSNTLLIGTVAQQIKPWGHPANVRDPAKGINRHPNGFGGPAQWNGAMFVMQDGSVRFVSDSIDPDVLRRMGDPGAVENTSTAAP